ncbi:hypothetical protein NIIDMKKI_29690 [Mycobacterium kansasii]|uniref:Uncharacterized protein n=1 Tax=Mycobacterium kansasii TaxID=1768 RepID=A0A7G1IBS8_MYCKA|nr:hypothetical protein NIIDMKKI_29690 [Mycobacterium kansasii]
MTVVGIAEHRDGVATAVRTGQPHHGHHSLGSAVAEQYSILTSEFGQQRGDFAGNGRFGAQLDPGGELVAQRVDDEWRLVTKEVDSETHCDVDVVVAVHIGDMRAPGGDHPKRRCESRCLGPYFRSATPVIAHHR